MNVNTVRYLTSKDAEVLSKHLDIENKLGIFLGEEARFILAEVNFEGSEYIFVNGIANSTDWQGVFLTKNYKVVEFVDSFEGPDYEDENFEEILDKEYNTNPFKYWYQTVLREIYIEELDNILFGGSKEIKKRSRHKKPVAESETEESSSELEFDDLLG